MGRKPNFGSLLLRMAREAERAGKRAAAERNRQIRLAEQQERQAIREQARREAAMRKADAAAEKEAKKRYSLEREAEVSQLNNEVNERIKALETLLVYTLEIDDTIAFDSLRPKKEALPKFQPPFKLRKPAPEPNRDKFRDEVKAPSRVAALIPAVQRKYVEQLAAADLAYEAAVADWKRSEKARQEGLLELHAKHQAQNDAIQTKIDQQNMEVDELERAYLDGDPDSIVAYNTMVLERSEYPDDFPQQFNLAYVPESRQLVVEYELPTLDVIPVTTEYRYVKSKDEVAGKARKQTEIKVLYRDIVASVALRTIHEVLEADQGGHIDSVCFNGFVQTADLATGHDIRPHLISVRATKESFVGLDLARVDKQVCLRNLGAQVSKSPAEAQPVRPIVDFDMVDKRFVEQSDVLADLDARPNLMELNPFEFEHLVANLFERMGLDSKLTRSSKDGGVDCIAFDPRPVLGGKVVIQAKRYRNTVGVSAVRDLYGTMMNEGANKGILVTTSGYGPDAFNFCKDKPIELIDGGGLLYLLKDAGVDARIVFPEEPSS